MTFFVVISFIIFMYSGKDMRFESIKGIINSENCVDER